MTSLPSTLQHVVDMLSTSHHMLFLTLLSWPMCQQVLLLYHTNFVAYLTCTVSIGVSMHTAHFTVT